MTAPPADDAGADPTNGNGPDDRIEGLKCGLEIHQQLDVGKLFCRCASDLVEEVDGEFVRALKPARSELGEVDRAALVEAQKGLRFRYQVSDHECLVEADEEPPHDLNPDALEAALQMAAYLGSDPVDEVHVMRKIVIDGSNTTGFQRTCLVATGGRVDPADDEGSDDADGAGVSVQTLCLEEDAARVVETRDGEVVYKLDRLGIPLIELATGPDIRSPAQARDVALRIGSLLRATGKAKRGLGTIRQDLNVSVPEGARVEIKGVQQLDMIPTFVETEARRQRFFADLAKTLADRAAPDDVPDEVHDVTGAFDGTDSGLVRGALDEGHRVLALALPGFAGHLAGEPFRLGRELADHASVAGVQGILHSDELPGFGIADAEVAAVRQALDLGEADRDAFALVVAPEDRARAALARVADRARQALSGVPEETRDAQPDGHTRYSRPLPGEARMYPETDVPPVRVTEDRFAEVEKALPERPEELRARLAGTFDLSGEVLDQLLAAGEADRLERLTTDRVDHAGLIARLLLQTLPERDLADVDDATLSAGLDLVAEGRIAKEALPDVVEAMAAGRTADEAVEALGLETLSPDGVAELADALLADREDFVHERGMEAVGPLMGPLMEQVKGRADGAVVSDVLKERLKAFLDEDG